MDETVTFRGTDELRKALGSNGWVTPAIFLAVVLFTALSTGASFGTAMALLLPALVVGLALFGFLRLLDKHSAAGKRLELSIGPTGVLRESPAGRQEIAWADLTRVSYRQTPKGQVARIDLTRRGGAGMTLVGLEDMGGVLESLRRRAGSEVEFKPAKAPFGAPSPAVFGAVVLAIGLLGSYLGGAYAGAFDPRALMFVVGGLMLVTGFYGLVARPLVRSGMGSQAYQISSSASSLVIGLIVIFRALR